MDNEELKNEFEKKTIFKQFDALNWSYVPDKLYCRDETW